MGSKGREKKGRGEWEERSGQRKAEMRVVNIGGTYARCYGTHLDLSRGGLEIKPL